ncbi:spiroplasma phage ORF1-like family protein [Spiroplasma endosymbiont of Glossina fuscipes fuscipes]|uniref:spiroplasma phage ORF1-like family protein n=1 Tax=Spiroplasma endosymbiont of Glossina fuscipes fuscipes TaxID=2004463 RepID=UPI003C736DBD
MYLNPSNIVIFKPIDQRNYIVKFNSKWDVLTPGGNISFQNYYINFEYIKSLYRYDNNTNEPELPEIDNNGKLIFYTHNNYQNICSFLLKYIDVIVQENIRVQQGGNPNYDDTNLGSQIIYFYVSYHKFFLIQFEKNY